MTPTPEQIAALLTGPMPPEVGAAIAEHLRLARDRRPVEPVDVWQAVQEALGLPRTGVAMEHDKPVAVPPAVRTPPR